MDIWRFGGSVKFRVYFPPRSSGFQSARRDVAETSAAKRRLFVGARNGGFALAHHGPRNCFRLRADPGRFEWPREAAVQVAAAKRLFFFRAKRGCRDFRRVSAVAFTRAKQRFGMGACCREELLPLTPFVDRVVWTVVWIAHSSRRREAAVCISNEERTPQQPPRNGGCV